MNSVRFIAAARLEFLVEIIYYSEAEAGLGARFAAAVEEAAARALAYPRSGSPFGSNTRRVLVNGFPFSLIYQPEPEGIVIFAVAHHARRPYYWQSRVRAR
ncbi:MAG: type II toxin-antitoxin system RelE/ParE family toxin [Chromatiales bacterium]